MDLMNNIIWFLFSVGVIVGLLLIIALCIAAGILLFRTVVEEWED